MAISQLKFSSGQFAGKDVASLPNRPGDTGITPAQLKARFDNIGKMMIAMGGFNQLIDELIAQTGAGEIGAAVPGLTGKNVAALLAALKAYEDAHRANKGNPHAVTKGQIGLDRVDNTADRDKPVSTAQAAAIGTVKTIATNAAEQAQEAQTTAAQAKETAQQAQAQASTAITQSNDAKATAQNAYIVAMGIAATAQEARDIAVESSKMSQNAIFTAERAEELAEAAGMVFDPVTGLLSPISEALRSIYNMVKSAPMTAGDFATNSITVDFFKSKNMTVTEFATRGRQILIGG